MAVDAVQHQIPLPFQQYEPMYRFIAKVKPDDKNDIAILLEEPVHSARWKGWKGSIYLKYSVLVLRRPFVCDLTNAWGQL